MVGSGGEGAAGLPPFAVASGDAVVDASGGGFGGGVGLKLNCTRTSPCGGTLPTRGVMLKSEPWQQ